MSFFEDASLVLIPSAQKTSKVYSVKPTDGTGDLTFTRSNDTATRVGPDGLIEKVRTNLNLYSEQFDNAYWIKLASSVTANAGTAPDGTTTADKIIPNTTNTNHLVYSGAPAPLSAGEYSMSIYVKASGYSKVALRESQSVGFFASFDLTNGTILDSSSNQTNTITSVGDGWYRITSTRSFAGNIALGLIPLLNSYTSGDPFSSYAGDGTSGILVWGAQMEFDVPTDYIATTTAAVSVGPVANVPRLDYLGSSCPRLLLEPQRTNFATYNEAFSNWGISAGTITSNATTSPDGYVDADLFTEDTTTGYHRFSNSCTGATGTTKTFSVYAKWAGGTGRKWLTLDNGPVSYFDLENGVVGSAGANCTSSITAVGNDWYRCVVTHTASSYGTLFIGSSNVNGGAGNHLGNGEPAFYVWGAQCEDNASYPTSVIPTLGAAVTRGVDSASKTGISSLIGQSEGTLFAEFEINANNTDAVNRIFSVTDGTLTSRVMMIANTDETFRFIVTVAGTSLVNITTSTSVLGGRHKVAFAYKASDFVAYVDGVQVGSNTAVASVPASLTTAYVGTNEGGGSIGAEGTISQALLFKTRLSNADLAALTA